MNKRILIICNCSSGLNDFRGMLINKLVSLEFDVWAVVPPSKLKEEIFAEEQLMARGCRLIKIPVDRRGINPLSDLKLFLAYKKTIKRVNPNLVLTYTIKPNIYGGVACRLLKIPYAVNITGLGTAFENGKFLKKIVTIMNRVGCKDAKVVFFENEANRQLFIKEKIVKESQAYCLNGAGVDLDRFQVCDYPDGNTIKFLFMGRVMAEKGIDELFFAMRKLVADKVKCELDVLGGYEENYKDIIKKYEDEGWLHYYGYQEDVRPFIERCHCFVLPSWHEGMANTNLESAASGRPIITSNIHGCLEAVVENKSGFLVEKKNAEDLYTTMKKFAYLSYEERMKMGLLGRKHMENVFDKEIVVEDTISKLL